MNSNTLRTPAFGARAALTGVALIAATLLAASNSHAAGQTCEGGSSCIVPMANPNARAVANQTTDIVVNPIGIHTVQNKAMTAPVECISAGASECIRPQSGTYTVYPYPFATITAFQPGFGLDAMVTWSTSNAATTALNCSGPNGSAYAGAVTSSATNFPLVGSGLWTSGAYTCTVTATNALSRQASAGVTFALAPINNGGPNGQPPGNAFPMMTCQDYKVWDPVAMTMTYHLSPFGHGLAWFFGTFVQQYAWNTPMTGWNLVAGSHWTMGPTKNGGIYHCP